MDYNIEFQLASLVFVILLTIVFFSKKRWNSVANFIFRFVLIITLLNLILDITSVITITEVVKGNTKISLLNDVVSKLYLIVMAAYILVIDIYAIANTFYDDISVRMKKVKIAEIIVFAAVFLILCLVVIFNPLLYGGSGRFIYSYGVPSDSIYYFSTLSVVFCIVTFLFNFKKINRKRFFPILCFCVMEGIVAIIQAFNKELLIIGLGSAVVCFIMYFILENPDISIIDELNKANKRSRELILNILPVAIAKRLEFNLKPFFDEYKNVTIMFIDIVNFTKMTNEIGGVTIVKILNDFFGELDELITNYKIEKIKTIGDAYMVAAGIPHTYDETCEETVKFAIQVLQHLKEFNKRKDFDIHIRIGINNGRVVAGVIGKTKYIYDLWGESVNLASRLQTNGVADRIHVSESVKNILEKKYQFEERGKIEAKGFGTIKTYLLKQN